MITRCALCGAAGNYITIDHGHGYTTVYMHLSQMWVNTGNTVLRNQDIGLEGATGGVTSAHLHFEINRNGSPAGSPNVYDWDDAWHFSTTWTRGTQIERHFNPLRTHDSIGVYRNGTWYLDNSFAGHGALQQVISYGDAARVAVPNDYNGDGIDTVGLFATWVPVLSLRNSNSAGPPDLEYWIGENRCTPLMGDWDGDGTATPGFYCPEGVFYLSATHYWAGAWWKTVLFGGVPGDKAVAGDFDGNGTTDIGIMRDRPNIGNEWYVNVTLQNYAVWGSAWPFGSPGDRPVVGDWDGDGFDSIGVWSPSTATWYLKNVSCCNAYAWDYQVAYGNTGDQPVAGDWDGW